MSGFENYRDEASRIELEIERTGIALGIDWDDPAEVSALAREALAYKAPVHSRDFDDPQGLARQELFGLAQLMLTVMTESAHEKIHTHGGPVWKAFGRALWQALQNQEGKRT
jgi:hypothetical protein